MTLSEYLDLRKAVLRDMSTAQTDLMSRMLAGAKLEEVLAFESFIIKALREMPDTPEDVEDYREDEEN
jgi:NifU-like protein involved in Fe-S cluster formation